MVSETVELSPADGVTYDSAAQSSRAPMLTTFWGAQIAFWSFLILFAWTARVITYGDFFVATVMTLTVDPIAFLMTGALHTLFLSRRRRITSLPVILLLLCFSVASGFLLSDGASACTSS